MRAKATQRYGKEKRENARLKYSVLLLVLELLSDLEDRKDEQTSKNWHKTIMAIPAEPTRLIASADVTIMPMERNRRMWLGLKNTSTRAQRKRPIAKTVWPTTE